MDSANKPTKEAHFWLKVAKAGTQHEPGEKMRIFIWYLVFVVTIPILISTLGDFHNLRYYFSVVDIIANIFASVHEGRWMGKMYSMLPLDMFSYLSTNFLSLLAIIGASWTAIHHAMETKSVFAGVAIASILFTFTYLLPIQGVGYVIDKYSKFMNEDTEVIDMTAGFFLLFTLLIIENILVFIYLRSLYKISK